MIDGAKHHRLAIASIGSGISRTALIPAIRDLGLELSAGSCSEPQGVENLLAECGFSKTALYTDFADMLEQVAPTTVLLAGASHARAARAKAALQRGVNVLMEKPPALQMDEYREVLRVAERSTARLGGIVQKSASPEFVVLEDAARAKRFGSNVSIDARVPWFRSKQYYQSESGAPRGWKGTSADGSVLHNQGYHYLDLSIRLAAALCPAGTQYRQELPFQWVTAQARTLYHHEIEFPDTVFLNAKLPTGGMLQLFVTTAAREERAETLRMSGSSGAAALCSDSLVEWQFQDKSPMDKHARALLGNQAAVDTAGDALAGLGHRAHQQIIASFLEDKEQHLWDPIRFGRALALIEAAEQSIRAGGQAVEPQSL